MFFDAGAKRRQTNIYAYCSINQSSIPGQGYDGSKIGKSGNTGMDVDLPQTNSSTTDKELSLCVCDREKQKRSTEGNGTLTEYFPYASVGSSNSVNNHGKSFDRCHSKPIIYNVKDILGTCYHCIRHVCISCSIVCKSCTS